MASTRKTRNVSKRFTKVNEEWPDKDGKNSNKSRTRKRKLSDMLGSQWSKQELEQFYEAYRKYGKDWKKVAGTLRNRSYDMAEALYNMNKAYLSLPEGTATVAGLIAMMTDHYNILEGSDSDRESNDVSRISRKPQKRGRSKFRLMSKGCNEPYPDRLPDKSAASNYGCLSLLKKKCSGDVLAINGPRAVGKRTPRIPVSCTCTKDEKMKMVSPNKQVQKFEANSADDDGLHAALALTEAFHRGGSPQVSRTPGRRVDHLKSSPAQSCERKNAESEMLNSKFTGVHMDGDILEGSIGSREADNADLARDFSHPMDEESPGAGEAKQKAKKVLRKQTKTIGTTNDQFDDEREACSGTEEGPSIKKCKDETEIEVKDGKASRASKSWGKRSRQLFFGDESSGLDALQTLADLSLNILLPSSTLESESSIQAKEEKETCDEKLSITESLSTNHQKDKSKISAKGGKGSTSSSAFDVVTRRSAKLVKALHHDTKSPSEEKQQAGKMGERKRKPMVGKILKSERNKDLNLSESQKTEVSIEEGKKVVNKAKRASQVTSPPKHGKLVKPLERSSSSTDIGRTLIESAETIANATVANQVKLPTKSRNKRKMTLQKALAQKDLSTGSAADEYPDKYSHLVHNSAVDLKKKLSHCLSSHLLRRWCVFEWFYSAIDFPWFTQSEFVEYLNHVRLGHIPRLTRVEWGVIRSSLGKPRRFSKQFLKEEREKLEQYRESVRTHYAELRAGIQEGLPTDLARPLSVGQRVIACHPKTREIHDGSILTVDRTRCRVQFDRPELGVEFVMDIDCMPLNPSENMPEALRRRSIVVSNFCSNFMDTKLDDQSKEWKIGGSLKHSPNENSDMMDGNSHNTMTTLMKQAKGDTIDAIVQAKATANEVAVAAQQAMYSQPCTLAQLQAREADVRALAELTRCLDKKEALLIELRHMNEEVSGKQKDGDPIKDLEHFRKQYAMVLLQLRDANDQVASALLYLRQRNTYHGSSRPPWLSPVEYSEGPGGVSCSFNPAALVGHDSGSNVVEIVENSRRKARTMVGSAVEAFFSLKEGDDAFVKIGDALASTNSRNLGPASSIPGSRHLAEPAIVNSSFQEQTTSCTSELAISLNNIKTHISSNGNETQLPSELISSCVATLLMIQSCTERQHPPAEIAQILDVAVTSLQPCCQQNSPIYREIETCMGIIKNQMLALIPTPSTINHTDASIL